MPSSLVTDWKCVAQSGNTMDGRVIKPEWLTDMAETYDPKVYTAKIWIDHMRYESFGSVQELKSEKINDVVKLYAKICPTRALLQMNQIWEEKLHFSIEPLEDFAKTGKTYLVGLAMTDQPASLGTDEMRFAQITGRTFTHRLPGEPVPDLREPDSDKDDDFDNFFQRLVKAFQTTKQPNKPDEQGEDSMEKEQFDKLSSGIEMLTHSMTTVVDAIKTFTEKPAEGNENETETPGNGNQPETPDNNAQFKELTDSIKGLQEEFGTITKRLEAAANGTEFNETTAPAEAEGVL